MPIVAACQFDVTDLEPSTNAERIVNRIESLPGDVELAVFPEYALTGFVADPRVHACARAINSPAVEKIGVAAQDADVAVTFGLLERDDDALYNALIYVDSTGEITTYRKRHRWASEADFVEPGTERVVVETPLGTTGLVTCYDLNFVAESAAFADPPVDALLVAGAWPAAHASNWDLLVRARALDGVRWVVAAGRTGRRDLPGADPVTYAGRSAIVEPNGRLVGRLDRDERDLVRTLDPARLDEHRRFIGSVD